MKSIFVILICLAIAISGFAQNLCDNSSFEKGDFSLSTTNICIPSVLTVTDLSGGTNIKYVFDYKGQSLETVKATAFSTSSFNYSTASFPITKEITVLQIGTKNGKTSIACKNATVRSGRTPSFSYSVCDPAPPNSQIEINIPANSLNDYDSYTVNFGPGTTPITINKSSLPFKDSKPLTLPRNISVTASYNTATNNCPANGSNNIQVRPRTSSLTGTPRLYNANISEVELLTPKTVKVTFNGAFTTDPNNPYSIFMYPKSSPAPSTSPVIKMTGSGTFTETIPDASKSYCFYAQRYSACSFTVERSVEICTHPLFQATFTPFRYTLNYDSYPNITSSTNDILIWGIRVINTKNIIMIDDNNRRQGTNIPNSVSYVDNTVDCKKRYCYQVEHNISGMHNFISFAGKSISNQICVDRTKIVPPKLTDALVNTELSNLNKVTVLNNVTWSLRKSQFELHKFENNKYVKIDSVLFPTLVLNDRTPVQKSNLYKVSYTDECNSKSALSDSISSVFLKYSLPNFVTWNKDKPFTPNSINNYELIPLAETDQSALPGKIYAKTINEALGDLDPYDKTAYFRLKVNSDGTVPKISYSNLISIPITPVLYLPSAFTPNGDGLNDILEFKGKTKRFTDLNFKLYSRNGELLIELSNIKDEWDGNINGKPAPTGVYIYEVKSTLDDGSKYTKKGLIELLR